MHIFISAGEPSGDVHGANFIRTMRQLRPDMRFSGFGGDRMAAEGCHLVYPLCRLAVMGFLRVLANLHVFLSILSLADRWFRHHRPDAIVLIDYPGLHWWLARRAQFHGIPVFYFVPPQLWAWAGWRVRKMQRFVDHVLCTLPFEETWYRERGVEAHYVGHPYFDEVRSQRLDVRFVHEHQGRGGRIVGLLPGSRTQEVQANLPTMLRTAERLVLEVPDTRFLVACYKRNHFDHVVRALRGRNLPVEVFVGKTPEIIHLSQACLAVSGSVSLELLHHLKPTVITYRANSFGLKVARRFLKARFITLVNLLADRELYPEYLADRCQADSMSQHLQRWLTSERDRRELVQDLRRLRDEVGQAGACERAGRYMLWALGQQTDALQPNLAA